jgi:hypothetical protein
VEVDHSRKWCVLYSHKSGMAPRVFPVGVPLLLHQAAGLSTVVAYSHTYDAVPCIDCSAEVRDLNLVGLACWVYLDRIDPSHVVHRIGHTLSGPLMTDGKMT